MEYHNLEDQVLNTNFYELQTIHSVLSPSAIRKNTSLPTSNKIFFIKRTIFMR